MAVKITKDTIIGSVLDVAPQAAPLFLAIGMHCLGCPSSRGSSRLWRLPRLNCEPTPSRNRDGVSFDFIRLQSGDWRVKIYPISTLQSSISNLSGGIYESTHFSAASCLLQFRLQR